MSNAEVRLLGRLLARSADGLVVDADAWRTAKTVDLLRILAVAGDRPLTVDRLIDLLWPDVDRARGTASLRTAACQIRKLLGPEVIVRRGDAVVLQRVWCDAVAYRATVREVDSTCREGWHADTVALVMKSEVLYGGDLDVSAGSCDWLQGAREELVRLRTRCLLDGAAAAARTNQMRLSLELAQRADAIQLSDESSRALMRAWAGLGEMRAPLEVFERLRVHLAEQFGVDPSPQTRALYVQIVSACQAWPPPQLTIGQEPAVMRLVREMGRLRRSPAASGVVFLVGRPGSGRDSVMREAARRAGLPFSLHAPGHTRSADGSPTSSVVGFPEVPAPPPEHVDRLRAEARHNRSVYVVPVRRCEQVAATQGTAVVSVPPVDQSSFLELLCSVLQGAPTDGLARHLLEVSGGLAGLVCSRIARLLEEDRIVWTPDGLDACASATKRDWPRADPLRDVLSALSPYALDLLTVAAVADVHLTEAQLLDIVARLVPRDEEHWAEDFEGLVDAGLLEQARSGFRIREERVLQDVLDWTRPGHLLQARRLLVAYAAPPAVAV